VKWLLLFLALPVFAAEPPKVVSLAPSITEIVYAVGAQSQLHGVTNWCKYPEEAKQKPKVGGHIDPSLERIVAVHPDLVIVEKANTDIVARLQELHLNLLIVEHRNVAGIMESILLIGDACGKPSQQLYDSLQKRLDVVQKKITAEPVSALVIVGRTLSNGEIIEPFAASGGTFLGELLALAGGVDATGEGAIKYPMLSRESLLRLQPEVVFDLAPEFAGNIIELEKAWESFPKSRAVIIVDDAPLIPGPRFVETVELFARELHPEIDW